MLRNAPVLAALKLLGVDVVFRIANAPERGRIHDVLWRRVLPPFVTRFVPNSRFSYGRLQETGVPEAQDHADSQRAQPAGRVAAHRRGSRAARLGASDDSDGRPDRAVQGHAPDRRGDARAARGGLRRADARGRAWCRRGRPNWSTTSRGFASGLRPPGASDRVHFVGARENVLDIMKASYVLAAPILQEETFGNVALEARSVGLPVVTFARGGLTELVSHGRPATCARRPISTACSTACATSSRIRPSAPRPAPAAWRRRPRRATTARRASSSAAGGRCSRRRADHREHRRIRRRQVREVRGVRRVPLARGRTRARSRTTRSPPNATGASSTGRRCATAIACSTTAAATARCSACCTAAARPQAVRSARLRSEPAGRGTRRRGASGPRCAGDDPRVARLDSRRATSIA